MKLTFRTMLATMALAIGALGSTGTAKADAYLPIGTAAYVAPYTSGGSVDIINPCITRRWFDAGSYWAWGAVRCGESLDRRFVYRDYWYYDKRTGQYAATGRCWYDAYNGALWSCGWL